MNASRDNARRCIERLATVEGIVSRGGVKFARHHLVFVMKFLHEVEKKLPSDFAFGGKKKRLAALRTGGS